MCLRALTSLCVLVFLGDWASSAQQSNLATLEDLLNSGEAQQPVATEAEATDAGANRPAGTLARPKDGVKHPELDKAWADYDASVARITESIKAALGKQFDAATAKGDLDEAEKWQFALERFEKAGELPAESKTKAAIGEAVGNYRNAREELGKAYEAVVKALTMEKKIEGAKAVRREASILLAPSHEPAADEIQVAKGWLPIGKYIYEQSGGWTAPITIEPDGVSRCKGRLGSWTQIAPNRIRVTFWTGNWIEVQPGDQPGTMFAYRTHDGQTGLLRPDNAK